MNSRPASLCHVLALIVILGLPAAAAEAEATALTQVSAQLESVRLLLEQQQKQIESLRAVIAEQETKIAALQQQSVAARTTVAAKPLPEPVHSILPGAVPEAHIAPRSVEGPLERKWFEKYTFRGYTQVRYNRLAETNPQLVCEQCDRSIGGNNGFSMRRARFILAGDINERVSLYFQPDFASTSGNLNFGQVRDLYFDVALDKAKEFRVRVGQSKVPFSFENLQSSQNRLALDRTDATNSSFLNERDIGAFFYWAPRRVRQRFADLVNSGLKGSGDYGVVGVGTFNGQSLNRQEANNNLNYITRISYPFELPSGQIIEAGAAAYTGAYAVTGDQRGALTKGLDNFADRRVIGSVIVYPQPFGFQAEYNVGRGPQYNPATQTIESRRLAGGYGQFMYRKLLGQQELIPFVRYQYYSGGKKFEFDARRYLVRDVELGLEWHANNFFELVAQYSRGDRTFEDSRNPNNRQKGNLLRLQLQLNY